MKYKVKIFSLISLTICMLPSIGLANNSDESKSVYHAIPINNYGIFEIIDITPHRKPTTSFLSSRGKGENKIGIIESKKFTITQPKIRIKRRGWDSKDGNAGKNRVELIDATNGKVLLKAAPPQGDAPVWLEWNSKNLIGKEVFIRLTDNDANMLFAWLGLDAVDAGTDFQTDFSKGVDDLEKWAVPKLKDDIRDFHGIPFNVSKESSIPNKGSLSFEIKAKVDRIFLVGMINSIDQGCPVWAAIEHYSQRYFIGDQLGEIKLTYADGSVVVYPLTLGDSMWWGPISLQHPEPFISNKKASKILSDNLKLFPAKPSQHYLAFIVPEDKIIEKIELVDLSEKDGSPVINGLTIETSSEKNIADFAPLQPKSEITSDLQNFLECGSLESENDPKSTRQSRIKNLQNLLYSTHDNFPKSVSLSVPKGYRGPKVSFEGNEFAQVLRNIFYHNVKDMDERVDKIGMYHTSAKNAASWGGYNGFGTWNTNWGSYYQHSWARDMGRAVMELTALGIIDKALLNADYSILMGRVWEEGEMPEMPLVESHGMTLGPYDIDGKKVPYHWCRILNVPGMKNGWLDNDSHGLTMMEMYNLWKTLPNQTEWLKSRWKYLAKAGDWVQWLYDNPELSGATNDNILTDSESSHGKGFSIYPDYTCMEGLLGFAEMADSIGETEKAKQWRKNAKRLRKGMERYLVDEKPYGKTWTLKSAGWPHHSTILAPVILAADTQSYTMDDWDDELTQISKNSYQRLVDNTRKYTPYCAYGAAMGYSQGFVTQSALLLDRMDEASEMLRWIARFTYYDAPIEAEKYLVPEGAEVIPTGEFWHRIGDLGNGVQQAETLKVLRLVIGVDNTGGDYEIRFVPRLPLDWTGIKIEEYPAWIQKNGNPKRVELAYNLQRKGRGLTFKVNSDTVLPKVELRLGALKKPDPAFSVLLDGKYIESVTEKSGDSYWVTCTVPAGEKNFTVEVR